MGSVRRSRSGEHAGDAMDGAACSGLPVAPWHLPLDSGWAPCETAGELEQQRRASFARRLLAPCPASGRGFGTSRTLSPSRVARTASASPPVTTTSSSTYGRSASTLQRTIVLPWSVSRSFCRPMRRASPAASTRPAISGRPRRPDRSPPRSDTGAGGSSSIGRRVSPRRPRMRGR